jgi:hypothetical protein
LDALANGDWAEPLRFDQQRMMELAKEVLETNRAGQFDNFFLRVEVLQARKDVVIDILVGDRNSICVFERCFLFLGEQIARAVIVNF